MKGKHGWILVLTAVALLFTAAGRSQEQKSETQKAPAAPPPEVAVAEVIEKAIPVYQEFVATTDGLTNATIRAQVQGYLLRQSYTEGSFVKKGQPLFEIDPRPFQAELEVDRAVLARHEAILQTARASLARILPLAEANAVSQKDKDDAVGRVQAAEAEVLAAQAEVRKAELDLSFTKIRSPIDGIAGAATAQIGDLVGPSQTRELTTVSAVDPIKVYVPISEREYMQAIERRKARKDEREKTQFDLFLTDGSTWPHKGTLGFADRQVDPQTGTIRVAILFPNPDNILRPGQYAKVRALFETENTALMVPQRAVGELQGIYQVAVVNADNTVRLRGVKVGERFESFWVIQEGLEAGEKVVAEGTQKVRDGVKVNPKPYTVRP